MPSSDGMRRKRRLNCGGCLEKKGVIQESLYRKNGVRRNRMDVPSSGETLEK